MSDLEEFLSHSTLLWHDSLKLIYKFGRNALNDLYFEGKIEVREGINRKVIRYYI